MSSSASSRPTAARRPQALSRASRSFRAGGSTTRASILEEMDLDAISGAQAALVLVDELAHTNAPGSRHPKRYMDVEELLAAGIDVFTTLNIQHVESLNDVVAQITRIRVRETVPDAILERADDIEVIDITPEDLIQRLNEGKVYVPETGRARGRPLLLARQPDGPAGARPAAHGPAGRCAAPDPHAGERDPGPWAAGERVLVCITRIRAARRWSAMPGAWPNGCRRPGRRCTWRRRERCSFRTSERDRIAETLRLAERLGGEAVTIPGRESPTKSSVMPQANNVTHIIIGKPAKLALVRDAPGLGRP